MRARILKPFRYSTDGVTAVSLDVGDERDISDSMAPGLLKEGWIAELPEEPKTIEDKSADAALDAPLTVATIADHPAPPAPTKRGRK